MKDYLKFWRNFKISQCNRNRENHTKVERQTVMGRDTQTHIHKFANVHIGNNTLKIVE